MCFLKQSQNDAFCQDSTLFFPPSLEMSSEPRPTPCLYHKPHHLLLRRDLSIESHLLPAQGFREGCPGVQADNLHPQAPSQRKLTSTWAPSEERRTLLNPAFLCVPFPIMRPVSGDNADSYKVTELPQRVVRGDQGQAILLASQLQVSKSCVLRLRTFAPDCLSLQGASPCLENQGASVKRIWAAFDLGFLLFFLILFRHS